MLLDPETAHRALRARDPRFDGRFFFGVRSTGIYCRPICPARTPRADRCEYFVSAAAAEQRGFRACLRCRPELAPGRAPIDAIGRLVAAATERIEAGDLDRCSTESLASGLGVSPRHLRRAFLRELGTSPTRFARTRRLAMARQLLTETDLDLESVAATAGFGSLRRFQSALRESFGRSASEIRGRRRPGAARGTMALTLAYRPPLDADRLLRFLAEQRLPGVERVEGRSYTRVFADADRSGLVRLEFREPNAATLELPVALHRSARPLVRAMRRLFDLDTDPESFREQLASTWPGQDLAGVRVPGAFEGFEVAVHAVLSQAVTVQAANTFCARLVERYGTPVDTRDAELSYLPPSPADLAAAQPEELREIGLTGPRAKALSAMARLAAERPHLFHPSTDPAERTAAWSSLPGIGPWTCAYLNLRLGTPDAFPASDLGLRRALTRPGEARIGAVEARRRVDPLRPWRAYAALHLWHLDAVTP